jgi:hypothetical protein
VERRQASAPAAEGRRKPALRGAQPCPLARRHETLRLSAFRFLLFFRSFVGSSSFVIAGHSRSKNGVASLAYDPAIHAAAKPAPTFWRGFAIRTSPWITGSSPVVTKRVRRCLTSESEGSRLLAQEAQRLILPRYHGRRRILFVESLHGDARDFTQLLACGAARSENADAGDHRRQIARQGRRIGIICEIAFLARTNEALA